MHHRRWPITILCLTAATALLVLGCSDDTNPPTTPGVEPEVVNDPDAFAFQVSSVQRATGTWTYAWSNSGTLASVDQSCSIANGRGILTLLDADGVEVYSRDLSTDGSLMSDEGISGGWQIRVVFADMSGTINFRVEKGTP